MGERRDSGFTLVEMMFAMVLFGILVGIAAPPYARYRTKQQHLGATRELVAFLRKAQVRAVSEETKYSVVFASNGKSATMYRYADSSATTGVAGQVLQMPSSKITMTGASFAQPLGGNGTTAWFYAKGSGSKGTVTVSRSGSSKTYTVDVEGLTARVSYE